MKTYKYTINGKGYEVEIAEEGDGYTDVTVNGVSYRVEGTAAAPKKVVVRPKVSASPREATQPASTPRPKATAGGNAITSPLPGVILDIKVKEGDTVTSGQSLMVLEAMKMENNIEADRDGKVVSIAVKQGDSVMEGDPLITIGE